MNPSFAVARHTRNHHRRGYSLVIVLLTLGLVIVAITSLMTFLEVGVRTSADSVERRRMFYVCDGMTRIVGEVLRGFMQTATLAPGEAGSAALRAYIERSDVGGSANLEKLMPDGFVLNRYAITDYVNVGDAVPVPSGPFAGMVGKEDKVRLEIEARRADGRFTCATRQELALTQVGLFQMTFWSALPKTRLWFSSDGADSLLGFTGRMHANGDLDISEGPDAAHVVGRLYVENITASGTIRGTCGEGATQAALVAKESLWSGAGPPLTGLSAGTDTRLLEPGDTPDNPLTNYPCTDADWLAAIGTLSKSLGDRRSGVQPLSLPLPTTAATAGDPLRFIIEPVLNDAAVDERERHKLAYKADLRIINGVWYLANPANRGDWPGTPIWSDHPGSKTERFQVGGTVVEKKVGQDDLRLARGWGLSMPRKFSPYGYVPGVAPAGATLVGGLPTQAFPIVYGTANRAVDGGAPTHTGVLNTGVADTSVLCTRVAPVPPADVDFPFTDVGSSNTCAGWTQTATLLSGASMGFQDVTLTQKYTGAAFEPYHDDLVKEGTGNILPINFHVGAFLDALATTTGRELGAYFVGRRFNGIVWIASRWPTCPGPGCPAPAPVETRNSWTHPEPIYSKGPDPGVALRPTVPVRYYFGTTGDPEDTLTAAYPPLPYPLCSDTLNAPYIDPAFAVHRCSSPAYSITRDPGGTAHAGYPNALLVTGASSISRPLTIATNLPAYVVGDVNTGSPAADTPGTRGGAGWVPFAVAADNVALLSSSFIPAARPWWNRHRRLAPPINTTFHVALLTGTAPGTGDCTMTGTLCGASATTAFRTMEAWGVGAFTLRLRGSIVVGHQAKYTNPGGPKAHQEIIGPPGPTKALAWPSAFIVSFDHNLDSLANQPPGTEALGIQSVRQWERD